ncbi:energy-coupled thiamine transporter ThiT [Bacillus suaedaesalsae]|uniref:Energy-coupled thiamine transporter ThiT n=1 Tax=Bacillus suaedaesalsae TaxID=2810349 RepID=A0ABS2DJT4_9BACI|nr:energy-coupled thiamine transporter ThiT [Bacillus suaedaesalsae]MBM6618756.1 energy-coupled thiamine transporter ThiT [Bacillus suaedaesalsae]
MSNKRLVFLVEVAIFSGLALILDFISFKMWAQGGSISLAMVPVFLIAFRRGLKGGLLTGFLFGILQLITNPYFMNVIQVSIDYLIAFSSLGLAGLLSSKVKEAVFGRDKSSVIIYIVLGTFVGSLFRFIAHFIAGITFYKEFAPPETPVALYSLLYNGSYMLPGFIISAIVLILLINSSKRLLQTNS